MSADRLAAPHPVLDFLHKRNHVYSIELLKAPLINRRQAIRHLRRGGRHISRMDEFELFSYFQPETRVLLENKK